MSSKPFLESIEGQIVDPIALHLVETTMESGVRFANTLQASLWQLALDVQRARTLIQKFPFSTRQLGENPES